MLNGKSGSRINFHGMHRHSHTRYYYFNLARISFSLAIILTNLATLQANSSKSRKMVSNMAVSFFFFYPCGYVLISFLEFFLCATTEKNYVKEKRHCEKKLLWFNVNGSVWYFRQWKTVGLLLCFT